jgi:peptide deformylase
MVVKEVILLGDPRLRIKSSKIQDFTQLEQILIDLKETLTRQQENYGMGRGIAAPQIGYNVRVIYIQMHDRCFYLVNPLIIWMSTETFEVWDSCFSLEVAFFVKIKRSLTVKVSYFDEHGVEYFEEFKDGISELLQHEIDHLEGIVCSDHIKDPHDIVMRNEWTKRYRIQGIGM